MLAQGITLGIRIHRLECALNWRKYPHFVLSGRTTILGHYSQREMKRRVGGIENRDPKESGLLAPRKRIVSLRARNRGVEEGTPVAARGWTHQDESGSILTIPHMSPSSFPSLRS